jgi:hypothetical protein
VALAAVASCGLVRSIVGGPAPRLFNHQSHLERGVGCTDCHTGAEKEVRAGMPSKEFCMNCHEELDKDPAKSKEKKVAAFLDAAGNPEWSYFTRQSSEIRFSHAAHARPGVACAQCHAGIEKNVGLVPGMLQRMDSCVRCHAERAPAKNQCSTCHERLGPQVAPPNHAQLWTKLHGQCSRDGPEAATANDCQMCHRTDSCITCHSTQPPDDHTNFWRLRAHGLASSLDRSRCAACHASDFCVRCHRFAAPTSHVAGWNAPRDRHCTNCHLPLASSGSCAVCHQSTPGHALAPVMPSWHNPSLNCRACHGTSLKHPDNGDSCTACHR